MTIKTRQLRTVYYCIALSFIAGCAMHRPVVLSPEAAGYKEFGDRINKYIALHKRLEESLPALNNRTDPVHISAHNEALAKAIRGARPGAKEGDIFIPSVRTQIVRIIRNEIKGRGGAKALKATRVGNPTVASPTVRVRLIVSGPYPDQAPLSSMPTDLLLKLPQLPEQVDYRFVGRDLILRDSAANLIVDFIHEAIPNID